MKIFKQACWLYCKDIIWQYLLSNSYQHCNGAAKAVHHGEMCKFYVAVMRDVDDLDKVLRHYEGDYKKVHTKTQELTDYLDEAIGFPLEGEPDYDSLTPKFFDKFHSLAIEALGEQS